MYHIAIFHSITIDKNIPYSVLFSSAFPADTTPLHLNKNPPTIQRTTCTRLFPHSYLPISYSLHICQQSSTKQPYKILMIFLCDSYDILMLLSHLGPISDGKYAIWGTL